VEILGVRVDDVTSAEMLQILSALVHMGGAHQISTVNTEFVMCARRDREFADVLRNTFLNVPDSAGILWAARWLGHPLRERVTGSDGIHRIAELCAKEGFRLFLLGAAPGVAERTAHHLTRKHPELIICGTYAGSPVAEEDDAMVERIRRAGPDVLLVAYSQSLQEKWIARNLNRTGAAVTMGVGAAFDFVAGTQVRAPAWMQRLGLEWLFRLVQEPWRWRRMLSLPKAAWFVFWQRLHRK
jgi:N-acetylglucosaminyldiphosphoundecaprenol N-acetyl-beta-D-mannosaminyltransferase